MGCSCCAQSCSATRWWLCTRTTCQRFPCRWCTLPVCISRQPLSKFALLGRKLPPLESRFANPFKIVLPETLRSWHSALCQRRVLRAPLAIQGFTVPSISSPHNPDITAFPIQENPWISNSHGAGCGDSNALLRTCQETLSNRSAYI